MTEWWKFQLCVVGRFFMFFEVHAHNRVGLKRKRGSFLGNYQYTWCSSGGFEEWETKKGNTCWSCVKSITWALWTRIIERGGDILSPTKVRVIKVRKIMCCVKDTKNWELRTPKMKVLCLTQHNVVGWGSDSLGERKRGFARGEKTKL